MRTQARSRRAKPFIGGGGEVSVATRRRLYRRAVVIEARARAKRNDIVRHACVGCRSYGINLNEDSICSSCVVAKQCATLNRWT